ncbi:MAG: CRISPR-associated protein Cas4 [Limisphaerales bacterium]
MSEAEDPRALAPEPLPLSLLNDYLYCPHRAALKAVEGRREANVHTERGDIAHEHSDLPGYEVAHGVTLLRALPVWSDRLGLNGKCDIVERHPDGRLCPVEFKVGRRRQWENDDAQLCAQALCLEEMFGGAVPSGAVFHAESKRRRQVEFTPEPRRLTADAIAALRALATPGLAVPGSPPHPPSSTPHPWPAAVFKPGCKECSLYGICLPELAGDPDGVTRAAQALFRT